MPDALDACDLRLLNDFQRGFPLVQRPFAAVAGQVGASEREVLRRYRRLTRAGIVSRIGVVFRPNAAGASILVAVASPPARLQEVAAYLSAQPEVNHNYQREHRYNIWFVLTAPSLPALDGSLARIEGELRLPLLLLPLLEEFHIDLGFDLRTGSARRAAPGSVPRMDEAQRPLVAALQDGFPLVPQPYAALARAASMSVGALLAGIGRWLEEGVARRVGVVVRHRRLGYESNAMVVWDVPDAEVGRVGAAMAAQDGVTLCYRRPRRPPEWPYNLFCMIHGRERGAVLRQIDLLREKTGIAGLPHEVLFSTRCFKQRGARYAVSAEAAHG